MAQNVHGDLESPPSEGAAPDSETQKVTDKYFQECLKPAKPNAQDLNFVRSLCLRIRGRHELPVTGQNGAALINAANERAYGGVAQRLSFAKHYFRTGKVFFGNSVDECREMAQRLARLTVRGSLNVTPVINEIINEIPASASCAPEIPAEYRKTIYGHETLPVDLKAFRFMEACFGYLQEYYARQSSIDDGFLRNYTSTFYQSLNAALRGDFRGGDLDSPDCEKNRSHLSSVVEVMNRALRRYDPYVGTVYRKFSLNENKNDNVKISREDEYKTFVEKHRPGAIVKYAGYTSTSKAVPIETGNKSVVVSATIDSLTGADLSQTINADEQEVLFKAGTCFKVISIEDNQNKLTLARMIHLQLKEVACLKP